jgi:hypothetical protein
MQNSSRLRDVRYDLRGPVQHLAKQMEVEGHRILRMNRGDPAPFGLEAPEPIVVHMIHHLRGAQGYSDSKGIFSARTAISFLGASLATYFTAGLAEEGRYGTIFALSFALSIVLTAAATAGHAGWKRRQA